jgi:8-oxo-dGTP pyrophosphatase MutT (NUDIX family)
VLQSQVVVDNWPYTRTRRDLVRLPNGDEFSFFVQEYSDWVNAVVLTTERQIVLVRQYRHAIGDFVLEIPGGMIEGGETPVAAATREVAEETGYTSVLEPIFLGRFWPNPAAETNQVSSFLFVQAAAGAPRPDRTEELEQVLMDFDAYGALVKEGRIRHMFSVLAYYRACEHLSEHGTP